MDNILDSNCKDLDNLDKNLDKDLDKDSYKKLYIDTKLKALEIKLLTYIDIYNITYTKLYKDSDDTNPNINKPIIKYTTINLERIGNIEKLYTNFTNHKKTLNKQLSYSIHKINILVILDTLHYIMIAKRKSFDFHLYSYELFNVLGIVKSVDKGVHNDNDNIYVIQQKNQNLNYNFTGSCIMLIFIRDKMFIHYY